MSKPLWVYDLRGVALLLDHLHPVLGIDGVRTSLIIMICDRPGKIVLKPVMSPVCKNRFNFIS